MRCSYRKKIIYGVITILIFIIFSHPGLYGRSSYEFIEKHNILKYLHEEVNVNLTSNAFTNCDYHDIINDETTLSPNLIEGDLVEGHGIRDGGEYIPQDCRPKFSTAIIVPYRDRAEQLRGFLVYMHTFFRRQRIHYRIFIIEQVDSRPFNRAKLLNIGAAAAINAGFPCIVLHDVDLLPLRPSNLYACTKQPRHMSSSINKFRFVLPYLTLFGGVISIRTSQYKMVNGMSNEYFGWGAEDDDLYSRLQACNFKICRFGPEISQYHMFSHKLQRKGKLRSDLLSFARKRMAADGLSSLHYLEVATVLHPLFTHIMVDL